VRKARKGRGPKGSLPYPELANTGTRAEHWEVDLGENARTSLYRRNHKVMVVPDRDDDNQCPHCEGNSHVDSIRVHEMFHSRFSPQGNVKTTFTQKGKIHDVDPKYIHMAEEQRVDFLVEILMPNSNNLEIFGGIYRPYCPDMYRDSLRHHIKRGEFREAAEISCMVSLEGGVYGEPRNIFHNEIEEAARDLFKSIGIPENNWERFNQGLPKLMETHVFRDAWTKMSTLERKRVAKQLTGLSKLYEHYDYLTFNAIRRDNYYKRAGAKKISWPKMLRYAYELEARFKEYDTTAQRAAQGMEDVMNAAVAASDPSSILKNSEIKTSSNVAHLKYNSAYNTRSPQRRVDQIDRLDALDRESEEYWRDAIKKRASMSRQEATGDVRWGEMEVLEPDLPVKYPVHKLQRGGSRAREAGDNPRMMHRYTSDGKIFKTKRKVYGASVLVDDSGSMGFTQQDLADILERAPGSIVGIYAGARNVGWLKIVARDGRRISKDDRIGIPAGNNLVDLPALQWLADQPWPRIWISDGQVVALNYGFHAIPRAQCDAFCEMAGIVRVEDAEAAQAYITGKLASPVPTRAKYRKSKRKELKV
jgi:hypothetical protein